MLQPAVTKQESDAPSLKALVSDPYIIIAAGKLRNFFPTWYNLKRIVFRCYYLCKYWNSYAGTLTSNMDDGYHECRTMGTGCYFPTCFYILFNWYKLVWSIRTQNGTMVGIIIRSCHHWSLSFIG